MSLIVTIFTDASFDTRTNSAGWAAWIKCNGDTTRLVRPFKTVIENSTQAEIGAAANAICFTIAALNLGLADRIILQTDCATVLHALDFKHSFKTQKHYFVRACREAIEKKFETFGRPAIEIRHVKAHQGKTNARAAVNDWADKAARKQMQQVRDALGKRNHKHGDE